MNILITGGTGSLGRALTTHLLTTLEPYAKRVVIYSRDEWKQAEMAKEFDSPLIRFFLGDVRDRDRLQQAMVGIDVVIHAAALKRVDAVAYNPSEVIKTNVYGTMNVVGAAVSEGVGKVVVVSSDKAVMPTNIYGASKMMAEQYAVHSNSYSYPQGTRVSCVRYGNVLGSRGSVVGIFRSFLADSSVVPITNPACTRFLITMDQAVRFVLGSLDVMDGGEIFVPILRSAKILDLLAAVNGGKLPMWEKVGLRSGGEKLHESLMNPEEITRARILDFGYVILPAAMSWNGKHKFQDYVPLIEFPEYTSRDADMTVDEIRGMLATIPGC